MTDSGLTGTKWKAGLSSVLPSTAQFSMCSHTWVSLSLGRQRKRYPITSWITMIYPVNSRLSSQTGVNHKNFIESHNYGSGSISSGFYWLHLPFSVGFIIRQLLYVCRTAIQRLRQHAPTFTTRKKDKLLLTQITTAPLAKFFIHFIDWKWLKSVYIWAKGRQEKWID